MEVKIKIFKRKGKVFSETKQKDVYFTDFFIELNGELIPIEVKYFKQAKFDGRDPGFAGRVAKLELVAENLPEKTTTSTNNVTAAPSASDVPPTPSDLDAPPSGKK